MIYNTPYYPIPTGYISATGFIKLNINNLNNFDFISINQIPIYYHNDPQEYGPPSFFNSTGVFIDNINNNTNYGIKLNIIDNTIYIASLLGKDGNNITLSSNNSAVEFNGTGLLGGEDVYPFLSKPKYPLNKRNRNLVSPIFSGKYINRFYVTGFYTGFATTGFLNGSINSFLGVRDFKNVWNISTGFVGSLDIVDFKSQNYIIDNEYIKNDIFNVRTPINVTVKYNNNLSVSDNIDIAEIRIKDLNAPHPSLLSGINFRITGII
jgi:hypothetical protein